MAMTSAKNMPLSPASSALGLGDQLTQQLQDDVDERRKKLMQSSMAAPGAFGASAMSPASMALLGGMR